MQIWYFHNIGYRYKQINVNKALNKKNKSNWWQKLTVLIKG